MGNGTSNGRPAEDGAPSPTSDAAGSSNRRKPAAGTAPGSRRKRNSVAGEAVGNIDGKGAVDKNFVGTENASMLEYGYESAIKPGFDPEDESESKECQDECLVQQVFLNDQSKSLVCVFDGHGMHGQKVASWLTRNFEKVFEGCHRSIPDTEPQKIKKTFELAMQKCEDCVAEEYEGAVYSGSTATAIMFDGETAHVAWCGDSRAVVARQEAGSTKKKAIELSHDHKPENPEELKRITEAGGVVQQVEKCDDDSPMRVFSKDMLDRGRWAPGLAMSRSIGDMLATSLGCWAHPDYTAHKLSPDDQFVVVASDGLWEVFENDEAVQWISEYVAMHKDKTGHFPGHSKKSTAKSASQAIAEEAQLRWIREFNEEVVVDDTSVVIVWLKRISGMAKNILKVDHKALPHRQRRSSVEGKIPGL
mmetsp:Transcript_12859/g.15528  ORF Transcript_12859/g.15528 Transcript_12859/m.15528 type:complete len:419 (+) Transcript_12859:229-1485(+)|eukprot:CAMPEP_0197867924 /NCGR_PEP_ID=MMETSP1438-20131217/45012_1 /TAXON_ID=1461541 /ORGANISM="Pterosperma sp., Strain CCMP1384" /LENGTH=418 /DNA_ID=CAMNT_0043486601 /DNA_START=218 /DNA_END=1474 /DNA_ORIENTATION=+